MKCNYKERIFTTSPANQGKTTCRELGLLVLLGRLLSWKRDISGRPAPILEGLFEQAWEGDSDQSKLDSILENKKQEMQDHWESLAEKRKTQTRTFESSSRTSWFFMGLFPWSGLSSWRKLLTASENESGTWTTWFCVSRKKSSTWLRRWVTHRAENLQCVHTKGHMMIRAPKEKLQEQINIQVKQLLLLCGELLTPLVGFQKEF